MAVIQAAGAGETSSGFYSHSINQSLRMEENSAPYLYRTYGSSAGGNTKTWTFSVWVKIAGPDAQKVIWSGSAAGAGYATNLFYMQLRGDSQSNRLDITWRQNSSTTRGMSTNRAFRDIGGWYHIILACDTTQSTDAYKLRLYINGTEETSFSSDDRSTIGDDTELPINANSYDHAIGRSSYSASSYFDGYMAEIHFVDGTQLDETSFGETKSGIWIPKKYTGSHGTTGFYLPFDDSSAIGDDESSNTNDWTPSGVDAEDVVLDSPTNNFGTLSETHPTHSTLSESNLRIASLGTATRGNFAVNSGKWYFEIFQDDAGTYNYFMGVVANREGSVPYVGVGNANGGNSPNIFNVLTNTNGTVTQPTGSRVSQVVIGIALDMDGGNVYFYYNGSLNGKVENITDSNFVDIVPYMSPYTGTIGYQAAALNCGQDSSFANQKTAGGNTDGNGNGDFFHSVPSGYLAMCTANLPDPAIDPAQNQEPADFFNTVLYTGNGSSASDTQAISGVGFTPDFTWIKNRSVGAFHILNDRVRGAGNNLFSNDTAIENSGGASTGDLFPSFDSDGFTVKYGYAGSANSGTNQNSNSYVAWNWLAGGTANSNGDGTIASSVSANTTAGFSIVTYTGNASAGATVGHGLDKAPEMYVVKARGLTTSWVTYHKDAAASPEDGYLVLNDDDAFFDTVVWNDTAPTDSVFSLGGTGYSSNNSGATYLAYCWHSVDGYSKVGAYTSTNTTDGPLVLTGFRPAWVMVKNVTTGGSNYNWTIYDNKRSTTNPVSLQLEADQSADDESTRGVPIFFLSNGFKLRNSYSEANGGSSNTYVYLAFAEQPFKYSNAR